MPSTVALLTSDASLLHCQIELLKARLPPLQGGRQSAAGLGYVDADAILLRKKPADLGELELGRLAADLASEVLFLHVGPLAARTYSDEDAMPMRFRRWMFIHEGSLGAPAGVYSALWEALPDFLKRQAKGTTAGELIFLSFIKRLRDEGICDDFDAPPALVGKLLAETTLRVAALERELGKPGSLVFCATNGRVMAATRLGAGPLSYSLLEGIASCKRCGITETTPDKHPLLRAHRCVRAVAFATQTLPDSGFIEVPDGTLVTVGHDLAVQVNPLGASGDQA